VVKMKAIAATPKEEKSARMVEVPVPKVGDDEVLVRVMLVGLDGTDREIDEGLYGDPPDGDNFLIIGHESLGEVVEVGGKVQSLRPGDWVVATVRRPDGCLNCREGEYDMCLEGNYTERGIKGRHGYLSEFYVEEEKFLVKVPKSLGDRAVLLEPMSVAEKAVRMAFSVQERMRWEPKTAMVTGTGTLGLLTAAILRLGGLAVASVDRSDDDRKEEIFSALGVAHFNAKKIKLHDIPKELGCQIDLIVEETGSSTVALHSIMVVGTNGVVVLTSITGGDKKMEICSDCFNQGLVLGNKAVVGSVNAHRRDFEDGIGHLLAIENRWPGLLRKLITARYPPERIREALDSMRDNIKVAIEFEPQEGSM
jgi:threonine dehydrogenase-like Zn-dependent dehydrogenase